MDNRMVIGITMGDPASIGPEITVKVLADKAIYEVCRPIVIGDACVLEAARKLVGHEELTVRAVKDVKDGVFTFGTIDVLDMGLVSMEQLVRGQISAMCGDAAFQYVKKVIELAMDGAVDATVILCIPAIMIVVLFVPVVCYQKIGKISVVERMRRAE